MRDVRRTYYQILRTNKYSQHTSIICPVWLNSSALVYELSGCWFESRCSHIRYRACFEQGVPWHSRNYRGRIHSETRTWHDKNIQSVRTKSIFKQKVSKIGQRKLSLSAIMLHFWYIGSNQFDLKNNWEIISTIWSTIFFSTWIVLGTQMQEFIQKLIKHP